MPIEYHPVLKYEGNDHEEVKDKVLEFLAENGNHQRSYRLGKKKESQIFMVRGYPAIIEFQENKITLELASRRKAVEGLAKKIQEVDPRLTLGYASMKWGLTDRQQEAVRKLASHFLMEDI